MALAAAVAAAAGAFPGVALASPSAQEKRARAAAKAAQLRQRYLEEARRALAAAPGLPDPSQGNLASDAALYAAAIPPGKPAAASGAGPAVRTRRQAAASQPLPSPEVPQVMEEDPLGHMEADLKRAMAKPVGQRSWAMVIDTRKCVGCSSCTVACKAENKLPPGVVYRPVLTEEVGTYPNVSLAFTPRPCMHCDDPPCVKVCPVAATFKRPDGIVAIDYDACIGCRYCLAACPYQARTFDWGLYYTGEPTPAVEPYETDASFEYARDWPRPTDQPLRSPIGNARKCHFCLHRLDAGMLPACVTTCIGRATYFGDKSDPASLVSQLIAQPNATRLKEELGTEPRVYYLL